MENKIFLNKNWKLEFDDKQIATSVPGDIILMFLMQE